MPYDQITDTATIEPGSFTYLYGPLPGGLTVDFVKRTVEGDLDYAELHRRIDFGDPDAFGPKPPPYPCMPLSQYVETLREVMEELSWELIAGYPGILAPWPEYKTFRSLYWDEDHGAFRFPLGRGKGMLTVGRQGVQLWDER